MQHLAMASGLGFGLSLIAAIGAQNAFVLRQGLRRQHVAAVVAVCAGSDLVLIVAATAGLNLLTAAVPGLLDAIRWAGAAFLVGYAVRSAWRAWRPGGLDPAAPSERQTIGATIGTAVALTWLNPHVYLDMMLLGSLAAAQGQGRWWFAAGAAVASLVWFTLIGFGARWAAPLMRTPTAWRVLDAVIAVVMLAIAAGLVLGFAG